MEDRSPIGVTPAQATAVPPRAEASTGYLPVGLARRRDLPVIEAPIPPGVQRSGPKRGPPGTNWRPLCLVSLGGVPTVGVDHRRRRTRDSSGVQVRRSVTVRAPGPLPTSESQCQRARPA